MRRGRQGLTSRTKVIGGGIKEGGLFISFVVTISFSERGHREGRPGGLRRMARVGRPSGGGCWPDGRFGCLMEFIRTLRIRIRTFAFIVPYPSHEFARVGRLVVGRRQPARIDLPSYVLKAF